MAKRSAFRPSLNLFVLEEETSFRNAYIGMLIDRSGSMAQGEKMNMAKRFGALLCEAARDLSGLEGHVNAFDHRTFFQLGNFQRNAISALEAGGGNNDAGALECAAHLALASGKTRRLLIMISDGSPTQCTFESLKRLVERLHREHGIRCMQIALERMTNMAFPQYVDVSGLEMSFAVRSFVRLLLKNTSDWR
ncbi:MAG: VWA domain-containing protein [Planctomycetes bacterium]|nr:VWA domain-containing protein [Planctomycetota bacterium]